MENKWTETNLSALSSDVSYGYTESATAEVVGPKFLRITDIQNGVVDWRSVPYCPIDKKKREKYKLHQGDIVVARTGNSTGENYLFNGNADAVYASYLIRFQIDQKKADPRFVWYTMRSPDWWAYVQSSKTGSAQAGANAKVLGEFPINLPPLPEQKAIAHILGSLDDKIELNRRMNETLEATAQALFKSWFVDFDPVIDNALAAGNEIPEEIKDRAGIREALGDSRKPLPEEMQNLFPSEFEHTEEMGWIPNGWKISKFGKVSSCFDRKRIPLSKRQRKQKQPGTIPYYGATSVMDYVNEWIFDDVYLLIGEDGSVLKEDGSPFVQYIWGQSWVNNHAHVLQGASGVSTEHLMLFMQSQNIAAYVTGAVQLKINQKNMNSIPFLFADDALNNSFAEQIDPMYQRIRQLSDYNKYLSKIRDTLLPKLLSGEIRIPEAEKLVGDLERNGGGKWQ